MKIKPMLAHTTAEADDPLSDANTQNEKVWQRVVACFRTTKELLLEAGQQTAILTWKCLITVWRRKFWAFAFTIIPLLTVLALGAASEALQRQVIPPEGGIPLHLDKCFTFNVYGQKGSIDCTTVAYAPKSTKAREIMKRLATDLQFTRGNRIGEYDVVEFSTAAAMSRAILKHPGQIEMGIAFTEIEEEPNIFEYELWYNRTSLETYGNLRLDKLGGYYKVAGRNLALQQAVDAAILGYANGNSKSAAFKATINSFPHKMASNLMDILGQASIFPWLGSTFMIIGFTIQSLMVIGIVINEKESGVLFTVRRMGLIEVCHWLSWFLTLTVLCAISASFVVLVAEPIYKQNFFTKTHNGVLFMVWWLSSLGHCTMAIAIGSACPERYMEWAGAAFSTVIVFFTFLVGTFDYINPDTLNWQSDQSPNFAAAGNFFFFTLPCFHFGRIIDIIIERVKSEGDAGSKTFNWTRMAVKGAKLVYDESNPNDVKTYRPEGVAYSLWMLVLDMILYVALACYFGGLFSGQDGSMTKAPWYPLLPSFWGVEFSTGDRIIYEGDVVAQEKKLSKEENSVRVHKLSVSYGKVQALRETTFQFRPGQIWALLGHNGAGKSTLINVLSGMVVPTFGQAFVRGLDVKLEMANLQRVMGTCPQHDTLFSSLTGREHLLIYAKFKGLSGPTAHSEITQRLEEVELLGAADLPAATYSGGMKRRLSVAMAALGDPKILFYDEPTTGMDPVVRRKIWASIENMKAGRLMVLTTHSMEEADVLGDKVAILHEGRMRASGTSIELKSKFGKGYEISMILSGDDAENIVHELVVEILPGAEVLGGAGNMKIVTPRNTLRHLPTFFAQLKNRCANGMSVEWGISNSTLEEVFLRLIAMHKPADDQTASNNMEAQAYVDMAPEMVAFALDTWRPQIAEQGESTEWLLAGAEYLRGERGAELEPVTWRSQMKQEAKASIMESQGNEEFVVLKPEKESTISQEEEQAKVSSEESKREEKVNETKLGEEQTTELSKGEAKTSYAGSQEKGESAESKLREVKTIQVLDGNDQLQNSDSTSGVEATGSVSAQNTQVKVVANVPVPPNVAPGMATNVNVSAFNKIYTLEVTIPEGLHVGDEFSVEFMVSPPSTVASEEAKMTTNVSAGSKKVIATKFPKAVHTAHQVHGIISKSGSLQLRQRCFNCGSCCCIGFAILLTWAISLIDPVPDDSKGTNCTNFEFVVGAPNALCSADEVSTWMTGECDTTIGSPRSVFLDNDALKSYGEIFDRNDKMETVGHSYHRNEPYQQPVVSILSGCCSSLEMSSVQTSEKGGYELYCMDFNSSISNSPSYFKSLLSNNYVTGYTGAKHQYNWTDFFAWTSSLINEMNQKDRSLQTTPQQLAGLSNMYLSDYRLINFNSPKYEISPRLPVFTDAESGLFAQSTKFKIRYENAKYHTQTSRSGGVTVWFSQANDDVLLSTYIGVSNISQVQSVGDAVLASQNLLEARMEEIPFPPGELCGDFARSAWPFQTKSDGVVINNRSAPGKEWEQLFPDYGVHVLASSPSSLLLKFELFFYGLGWSYGSWPYARIFSRAKCSSSEATAGGWGCCDFYEVNGISDFLRSGSICEHLAWGATSIMRERPLDMRLPSMMSWMSNALLKTSTGSITSKVLTKYVAMPTLCFYPKVPTEAIGFQLFFVPFILSFLFPPFATMLTRERTIQLFHGMTVKGMTNSIYWLSNYVYALVVFSTFGFLYCALARSMDIKSFRNCGWELLSALVLCWSHAQAMLSFFLAGFIDDPKNSSIVSYLILFVMTIAGGVINRPDQGIVPYPWEIMLFPFMAFSRTLSLVLLYGGKEAPPGTPLSEAFLYLFFVSLIWGMLGIYIHTVKSTKHFGCAKSPDCMSVFRAVADQNLASEASETGSIEMRSMVKLEEANADTSLLDIGTEDELVIEAARLVRSGEAARNPQTAVLLQNFRRVYPARGKAQAKVAVDGIDLSINFGECFGLLGPNGAGKTTLLETLSGLAVPQGGKAFVGGVDISKDVKKALTLIGVCPQFDVVWNNLTVMNHLLLYTRLKGIPKERQHAAANLAAIKVGLDGDAYGLAASQLSGGMRRRLSIAASLVGDPPILILDEPTTGLDPDTRRQIWDILQREKRPNRTIIITTHSMEEADTLCTRIGIMAQGKLRAVGNQQSLKSRYGTGFKLDLVVKPSASKPDAFVQSLCNNYGLTGVQVGSTVSYSLPREGFDPAKALAFLQHHSVKNGIEEWSLAQPSLEEVFVNIAHRYSAN